MEFCNDRALEVSMFKYLKNVIARVDQRTRGNAGT